MPTIPAESVTKSQQAPRRAPSWRERLRRWKRRLLRTLGVLIVTLILAILIVFPGRQTPMALSLATGIGVPTLQAKVDRLEKKAIRGQEFTEEEKRFLQNLYTCFAKGGKLIVVTRQSGAIMEHYLGGSGEDLYTAPRIFLGSRRVQLEMDRLKQWIHEESQRKGRLRDRYVSRTFHMADPQFFESVTGLYYGRLMARPSLSDDGSMTIQWRAETTWHWPSYDYLHRTYGNYHAWCFPVPNAKSKLFGSKYCLWIDDGLGEYLGHLGLARPFLVYSEWEETVPAPSPN